MIDPGTAMLVGAGLNTFGGLLGGDKNKKDRKEQAREFDQNLQLQQEMGRTRNLLDQNDSIMSTNRALETSPLRDRVLYMLTARSGMTPGAFKPRDAFNTWTGGGSAPSMGGIDLGHLQQTASEYKPGAGGVDPRIYQALLGRMGLDLGGGAPTVGNPDITPPGLYGAKPPAPPAAPAPGIVEGEWNQRPNLDPARLMQMGRRL